MNEFRKEDYHIILNEGNRLLLGKVEDTGWIIVVIILPNGVSHRLLLPSGMVEGLSMWLHLAGIEAKKVAEQWDKEVKDE